MATFERSIGRSVDTANKATELMQVALMQYAAHCSVCNWPAAEEARLAAITHLEAHMDSIACVYKVLSQQK